MRFRRALADDEGSASVFGAFVLLALVVVTAALAAFGGAVAARHRAQLAGDVAALAGAGVLLSGDEAACHRAEEFATLHGAQLDSCTVQEWALQVAVSVDVWLPWSIGDRQAAASARAELTAVSAPTAPGPDP